MLTDAQCKSAKARGRSYKLSDSKGLHLFVATTGTRSWRWKFRIEGKEKQLVLGHYPDTSLAAARELRDDAAKAKRSGLDPAVERKAAKARRSDPAMTFEALARDWHQRQKPTWRPDHAANVLRQLKTDVFPAIGAKPINSIKAPDVLRLLRPVEARGAIDQAHRLRQRISAVFVAAIAAGLADSDPAATLSAALKPNTIGRHPALRTIEEARALLAASEALPAHPLTKLAARMLAVTTVRSEAVRFAAPEEFEGLDGAAPIWRIPAAHMKGKLAQRADHAFEFIVALPWQAVEIVQAALRLSAGAPLVFPGNRNAHRPMSDAAISALYRRVPGLNGRHVPHGWRATFSTIMNERAVAMDRPEDEAILDLMLAHVPTGVKSIYNRAAYMPRRRRLAQEWADMLLEGLPPAASLLEGPRS